jgi:DNA-binding MarR family transcriptional regulator
VEDRFLGHLLYRVAAGRRRDCNASLDALGLEFSQYICMRVLRARPGISSAELVRATTVSAQAMSGVLRSLESIGAVTRPESANAGRVRPAELTARGVFLLTHAESVRAAETRVMGRLCEHEQHQLKRQLVTIGIRRPTAGTEI